MSQETTRTLITDAYNLAGVVSEGFDDLTPDQEVKGLRLLNQLLDSKTAEISQIPYYEKFSFTIGPGLGVGGSSEEYFIPQLVYPSTLTFELGSVRYSVRPIKRRRYQGSARANDVSSLLTVCLFERTLNGTSLFVYPLPYQNFPAEIWGKFSLTPLSINDDLSNLEGFYIRYLRYALAEEVAEDNGISLTPSAMAKLRKIEAMIRDISPPDLTFHKMPLFSRNRGGINYGQVNIGRGWTPP